MTTAPPGRRTARGSYLDQLLAEPGHADGPDLAHPGSDAGPDWQSWWDTGWPVVDAVAPPRPASVAAGQDAETPWPRPVRTSRFLPHRPPRRPTPDRVPAVHRSRLPGRGVHVTRSGPRWSIPT